MNEQELIQEIRIILEKAENPLFIIDDDPDGVCAYLVLKKYINKGEFMLVKSAPVISEEFANRANQKNPDLIIILDIANVSEEFFSSINAPVVWIDHHAPQNPHNSLYYNPRNYDDNAYVPTSECAWNITQKNDWIAAVGIVEDWKIPPFIDTLKKEYPDLFGEFHDEGSLNFETRFGEIGLIFAASLKGTVHETSECIRLFEQLKTPYDFEEYPEKYELPLRKHKEMTEELDSLLQEVEEKAEITKEMVIFPYEHVGKYALTGMLSEVLSYKYKDKLILIARGKDGFYRMSIRAKKGDINPALQRAFEGTTGRGGGHKLSCGGAIPKSEFDEFIHKFKQEWKTQVEQL